MAVVGIDLGTTNTVIAAVRDGRATALKDKLGRALLPSVVSFTPKGVAKVGYEAKARRTIDPENTVFSIKRLIGRTYDSEPVQKAKTRLPFELREGPGKSSLVSAYGTDYTLPEISALVLEEAQKIAEARLGTEVTDAVITVPANFNDLQRAATKVAGRTAGLEVLRIINEPTAAALAYGFGKKGRERIAVYDFGGGTFDVTLLDLSENVFEVLATAGDTFLGGDDIDRGIMEVMAEELLKKKRVDASRDNLVREQLRVAAENLKIELSTRSMAKVRVEELEFDFSMRRSEFEQLAEPLLERTLDVCKEAMDIAGVTNRDLDQILLVGGSTRIPLVRRRISSFFGKMPQSRINPDEVVAIGAAIQASSLEAKQTGNTHVPAAPRPRAAGIGPSANPAPLGPPPVHTGPQGSTKIGLAGLKKSLLEQGGTSGTGRPSGGMTRVAPEVSRGPSQLAGLKPGTPGRKAHPAKTLAGVGPGATPSTHPSSPPVAALGTPGKRRVHKTLAGVGADSIEDFPRGPMKTLSGVGGGEEGNAAHTEDPSGLDDPPRGNTNLGLGTHPSSPPPIVGQPPPHARTDPNESASPSDFEEITTVNEGALQVAAELEKRRMRAKQYTLPGTGDSPPPPPPPAPPLEPETTDGSVTFDLAELESLGDAHEASNLDDFASLEEENTATFDPKKVAAQAIALDRGTKPTRSEQAETPEELGDSALIDSALITFEDADLPSPAAALPMAAQRTAEAAQRTAEAAQRAQTQVGRPPPTAEPPQASRASQAEELGDSALMALESDFDETSGVDLPSPAAHLPSPAAALPLGKTEIGLPSPLASRRGGMVDLPSPARPKPTLDAREGEEQAALPLVGHEQRKAPQRTASGELRLGLGKTKTAASGPDFDGAPRRPQPSVSDLDELSVASLLPEDDSSAEFDLSRPDFAEADLDLDGGFGQKSPPGASLSSTAPLVSARPELPPAVASPAGNAQSSPLAATTLGQGLLGQDARQDPAWAPEPEQRGPLLLDVTPLSLGVEVTGGYVDTLIQRNSPIPCASTRTFATAQDNQRVVRVRVSQGEEERFDRNTLLGEVELTGISQGPRGSVRIDVSFSLDESGMLQVSATDRASGNAANARLMLVGVAQSH